jgi:hypothetical protein
MLTVMVLPMVTTSVQTKLVQEKTTVVLGQIEMAMVF